MNKENQQRRNKSELAIIEAARQVKLVVSDVDGVLTDDTFFILEHQQQSGEENISPARESMTRSLECEGQDKRILCIAGEKNSRTEAYIFFVGDGIAIKKCEEFGIPVVLMCGRSSSAVAHRIKNLGIVGHLGVQDKAELMRELLEKYNVTWDEILFIGNDVQDLVFMRLSGFPAAPANAIPEVKEEAIFVSKSAGGYGAVRDILQFVLESKGHWNEIINKE